MSKKKIALILLAGALAGRAVKITAKVAHDVALYKMSKSWNKGQMGPFS